LRVEIRYARAAALEGRLDEALALVTPSRRERAGRYRLLPDRLRSAAAGLLLRRFLGVRKDADLALGPQGRPALAFPGPWFSLSHSGDFTGLAFCRDGPVGLDVEPLSREVRRGPVAGRAFSPEERGLLAGAPDDMLLFLSVWTRKECLLKAAGLGLFRDPASLSVTPLDAEEIRALGSVWAVRTFVLEGHVFSVAAPSERDAPLEYGILEATADELLA
jgi:4'-phosphopantetheinyl transferase